MPYIRIVIHVYVVYVCTTTVYTRLHKFSANKCGVVYVLFVLSVVDHSSSAVVLVLRAYRYRHLLSSRDHVVDPINVALQGNGNQEYQ